MEGIYATRDYAVVAGDRIKIDNPQISRLVLLRYTDGSYDLLCFVKEILVELIDELDEIDD